jgi:hydroxymethylglutaryl-CoA lyase
MIIVEVGPRDGLQNEKQIISTEDKLTYIELLIGAGHKRIEAVSFARPDRVPQMGDAEAVMAGVPRVDGVSYIGLVMNERGLDRAFATKVDEANIVIVATETFSQRNQNQTIKESLTNLEGMVKRAKAEGIKVTTTIGASFGCPFEGEVSTSQVASIAKAATEMGVDEIAIADTIGVGTPKDVRRLVGGVKEVTSLPLRLHLHNTRNTGYANAFAGYEMGVLALDASSGGIGGCPFAPAATGNIASEDLTYLLERSGIDTGLNFDRLTEAAQYITEKLAIVTPALLGRAGWFPAEEHVH